MTNRDKSQSERNEIEELLPWFVAGTLEAGEVRRVEAWLLEYPDAARQLEVVREEQAAAIDASEAFGSPAPGALDRLIQALPATAPVHVPAVRAASRKAAVWLTKLLRGSSGFRYRWAGVVAAAVIVLQTAALTVLVARQHLGDSGFVIASKGEDPAVTGTKALVQFNTTATAGQISALLESTDMEIVGGPRPGGVYIVRIASRTLKGPERDAILNELRGAVSIVTFAEPAD